jgi:AbrB family looped-hinge helix DNA binding protein
MKLKIAVDKTGRIVIPKHVRDALKIAPGDVFEIEIVDGEIVLRPPRGRPRVWKKRGVWVFSTGVRVTSEQLEKIRRDAYDERHARIENPEGE